MAAFDSDTEPTLRDIAEKRDAYAETCVAGGPINQAGKAASMDECAAASPADLNRYAAQNAKHQCNLGHQKLMWDRHHRAVYCANCGDRFVDVQPVRDQVKQQGMRGNWDCDEYMRGMFNGLECALATLEGREPLYR